MSRIAPPFLTIPDELVNFTGWMIGSPNEPLSPASDILENWDYERDIQIQTNVSVNFIDAATCLGINATDLKLAVVLVAGTGSSSLPRRTDYLKTAILTLNNSEVALDTTIPGHTLSGQLHLSLRILLDATSDSGSPLSPKQRGARLWQHHKYILIEDGGDSRFPIELASFSESFKARPEQYAPWLVDWNPTTLDADFSGNVRLYVNSDIEQVCARFIDGDAITLQAMVADVMTQIIEAALDIGSEAELDQYEEGSIGYQARTWMEISFLGISLENIRQIRRFSPGKFKALILSAADFRGVE
ncbi:hypothetical protein NHG97_25020 [Pseudomonas corrugata]|uniref:hypothetical protein n=1 Tax=Pseudomonas corrugata TaxID=47879 RepID=UPI0028C47E45|nr:hypothetical protein [Pseudomonas corrugata]MDU9041948.1 hypothetical protein [Pseudomonas corrugata]